MPNNRERNFKSIAKEAKNRLKSGFWENCKDELHTEIARAKDAGISESRAGRYFAGKITCSVKGGDDDGVYEKVKAMLLSDGEVSDAIGRLTDRAYFGSRISGETDRSLPLVHNPLHFQTQSPYTQMNMQNESHYSQHRHKNNFLKKEPA